MTAPPNISGRYTDTRNLADPNYRATLHNTAVQLPPRPSNEYTAQAAKVSERRHVVIVTSVAPLDRSFLRKLRTPLPGGNNSRDCQLFFQDLAAAAK